MLLLAGGIIAPRPDAGAPLGPSRAQHAVQHTPRSQQIRQRAQRPGRQRRGVTLQIGPRRRYQQAAAVRQHDEQLELPAAAHPPDQLKRAALQRVPWPHDPHRRREAIEVGLVSCLR